MLTLAIDPGATGGLALLDSRDGIQLVEALAMPIYEDDMGRKQFDWNAADAWAYPFVDQINRGVVEQVSAMPKQGVTSMFNFGRMVGAADAFARSFAPVVHITPQKWKKAMWLGDIKSSSRFMADKLFGKEAGKRFWPLVKHDGVAEAALLGYYYLQQEMK